jgi:hypothetical protein
MFLGPKRYLSPYDQFFLYEQGLMNVGDLRRFIAGSPDSRQLDFAIERLGVQSMVSLQNTGNNLTIMIKVRSGLQNTQIDEAP